MNVAELRAALEGVPDELPVFIYDGKSGPVSTIDPPEACRRRWIVEFGYSGADCDTREESEASWARRQYPDQTESVDGVLIQ